MPVYQCEDCGCVENTAVSGGWRQRMRGAAMLCSKCDPARGRWHGQFPRQHARELKLHTGADGMLHSPRDERAPRPLTPVCAAQVVRLVAYRPGVIVATLESADEAAFTAFRLTHERAGCQVECVSDAELGRAQGRQAAQTAGNRGQPAPRVPSPAAPN